MGLLQKELSMKESRLFELLSSKAVIKQFTLRMIKIQKYFGGLNIFMNLQF